MNEWINYYLLLDQAQYLPPRSYRTSQSTSAQHKDLLSLFISIETYYLNEAQRFETSPDPKRIATSFGVTCLYIPGSFIFFLFFIFFKEKNNHEDQSLSE